MSKLLFSEELALFLKIAKKKRKPALNLTKQKKACLRRKIKMCEKLNGLSMDLENTNMEKLKSVFPECFSEGKLDIDKLLSLCGEYIDNDFEKYKFEWKGKSECLRLAQKRSTGTLRPCKEKSVNFDDTQNVYIEGDNLEVLKLLQTAYFNKIKMIYIDPPYNTGNDFVYEDDFADPMARYKEVTQQTTKSNPETMGRYHTNWLNMMYPRLRLAANLLKEDGVIFINIDDNEVFNLKKVCDEVFGEENFVADLIWTNKEGGGSSDSKLFRIKHEHILCYCKNLELLTVNGVDISNEERYKSSDEFEKIRGKYYLQKLGMGSIQYSTSLDYPITAPDGTTIMPADNNNGKKACWRWSQEKLKWGKSNGFVEIKKDPNNIWTVYTKQYLHCDNNGNIIKRTQRPMGIIDEFSSTQASKLLQNLFDGKVFDYSKPIELIIYLMQRVLSEKSNDIVLDFFSGSATTAHAVMQLNAEDGCNRKFICVQLPELCDEKSEAYKAGYKTICEIGEERIRRAGKKILEGQDTQIAMGDDEKKPLDIGFKVFRLDTSNLKLWDSTPITGDNQIEMFTERMNSMIDSIKDDRTDMDVIYEIMLKMGIPLDTAVQYIEIDGKIVYIVGDFLLMIALYNDITAEDIDAMAAYAPAKIVCAEQGFKDDTALSNAHYILRDKQIELKLV